MRQRMAAGWSLIRAVTQYAQGVRGSLHRLPEIVLGDIRDPLKAGSDFIAELGLNDSGIPLGGEDFRKSCWKTKEMLPASGRCRFDDPEDGFYGDEFSAALAVFDFGQRTAGLIEFGAFLGRVEFSLR